MSLIDFSCLCMFIVFAQLTESRVLILRDDYDEPLVLSHMDRSSDEDVRHKHQASSNYKPKRFHAKKTILQYGRHIYHLDHFKDMKELRSEMTQRKPDSVSYDYFHIDDLFRDRDSPKNSVGDYPKDLIIFSNTPVQFCNGDTCDEDLRKFSKHKNDEDTDWKRKTQFGRMKRFQVVDNRDKSKTHDDSSEEYREKKKKKSSKRNKKKKKKHSSESTESESKESGSEEKSWGSHKKTKKKYKPPKDDKRSSEERVHIKRKPKKKHNDEDSTDASVEKWKKHDEDSKSSEDFHKKKKKKKKIYYGASDETTRKTFADENEFFMQGNKIFHDKEKRKKKHNDFDRRRRLEHFLPKRYHWDASDIHGLGYYWFNGPKGSYAAPKLLNRRNK